MDDTTYYAIINSILSNKEYSFNERIEFIHEFLKLRIEKQKVKEIIKTVEVASPCPFPHNINYPDDIGTNPYPLQNPIWMINLEKL